MVRTIMFDPSYYLYEVHSFSGYLGHERTCRAKLALRSTSERTASVQPRPKQLPVGRDQLSESGELR